MEKDPPKEYLFSVGDEPGACVADYLQAFPQYLYPKRLLSAIARRVTRVRSRRIKDWQIRRFIRSYRVQMEEALEPDPASYEDFNGFFTRALRPGSRPIAADPGCVVSPADGRISRFGTVDRGRIVEAKGREYTVGELLGYGYGEPFEGGAFMTIYLSPRDYHRVHMPIPGRIREMRYVPGRLFSVNAATVRVIPRLFARNERVILLFDTEAGPMALVMVAAIFVGGIETVWAGSVASPRRSAVHTWRYGHGNDSRGPGPFRRAEEIARFNMGSTVVLLFPPDSVTWDPSLSPGAPVRMGASVGRAIV